MATLETCGDFLESAPNSRKFLQAWQAWRQDASIPTAADVVVENLGSAMGSVSVLEVHAPERVVYRLFGSLHARVSGKELKGENLIDLTPPENRQDRMKRIWSIASQPCGAVFAMKLLRSSGLQTPIRGIILPVAPNAPGEPMRLYTAIDTVGPAATPDDSTVSTIPATDEQEYVDIGFGTPE
jgi:hypothetical protein